MTANPHPIHVDLDAVRERGRQVARTLQMVVWPGGLPAVFGLHLSGDVGQMAQEIEYLRGQVAIAGRRTVVAQWEQMAAATELAEIREQRVDPALLRWCEWPGCWRSFDATTGPRGEPGWVNHRHPSTLLCPDHDPGGHRPDFTWTPGDSHVVALCECGASAEVRPTNQLAVAAWWSAHVLEATR